MSRPEDQRLAQRLAKHLVVLHGGYGFRRIEVRHAGDDVVQDVVPDPSTPLSRFTVDAGERAGLLRAALPASGFALDRRGDELVGTLGPSRAAFSAADLFAS